MLTSDLYLYHRATESDYLKDTMLESLTDLQAHTHRQLVD